MKIDRACGAAACSFFVALWTTATHADNHLLLTEVLVSPDASQFVEIYNPTAAPIALDTYYLADDQDYAVLPGHSGGAPAPSIGSSDFVVRFPAGAVIEPNGVIVVALEGVTFFSAFGYRADFEIRTNDSATPDMIRVLPTGSSSPSLSGTECIALFHWDGTSDLVSDVDLMQWGSAAGVNTLSNKTGLNVDGPDAGSEPSAYAPDAMVLPLLGLIPPDGTTMKRISLEAPNETVANGNGITGHDETSENTSLSWGFAKFTAPDPGGTILHPPSLADLAIAFQAPGATPADSELAITLTLRNDGQLPATGVLLVCELPAPCSFMDELCTPPGLTLSGRGGQLNWSAASVPAGASFEINLNVHVSEEAAGTLLFDLAAATSSTEGMPANNFATLSIEINAAAPLCPADFVTSATFAPPPDGVVDGADLAVLLGDWGANVGSAADIVTSATFAPPPDGVVDGADLAVLLGAWGACK